MNAHPWDINVLEGWQPGQPAPALTVERSRQRMILPACPALDPNDPAPWRAWLDTMVSSDLDLVHHDFDDESIDPAQRLFENLTLSEALSPGFQTRLEACLGYDLARGPMLTTAHFEAALPHPNPRIMARLLHHAQRFGTAASPNPDDPSAALAPLDATLRATPTPLVRSLVLCNHWSSAATVVTWLAAAGADTGEIGSPTFPVVFLREALLHNNRGVTLGLLHRPFFQTIADEDLIELVRLAMVMDNDDALERMHRQRPVFNADSHPRLLQEAVVADSPRTLRWLHAHQPVQIETLSNADDMLAFSKARVALLETTRDTLLTRARACRDFLVDLERDYFRRQATTTLRLDDPNPSPSRRL